MKKVLMSLVFTVILMGAFSFAQAQTVYVTKNGDKFHKENCQYIKGKADVTKMSIEDAKKNKYKPCSACFGDDKKTTDKNKGDKKVDTKKTETPKGDKKTDNKKTDNKKTDNKKTDNKTSGTKKTDDQKK